MKIALAADPAAAKLKTTIIQYLSQKKIEFTDFGCKADETIDYPDVGAEAVRSVLAGECDRAILMCGTGIGMSMVANKFKGIRGTLCWNEYTAEMSRSHNDSNCLCLAGRVYPAEDALRIVDIWLNTPFEGGRHQRRLDKIAEIEKSNFIS